MKVKKQKGYTLLMMMAFSVLSLALVSTTFVIENNKASEANRENMITDTARQTVEFSLAVSKKLGGAGAIPGERISVQDLKSDKLINAGFPSSIAFNQNITSYYVTNPSNHNVIDVLTMIEGVPDERVMRNMGVSEETLGSFYNEVIDRGIRIGYPAEEEAEEFHVGIVTNNGNTLRTRNGDINISHVNNPFHKETFGIYATAPNQAGYWRFRIGPYISRPSPSLLILRLSEGDRLLSQNTHLSIRQIDNEGFTYFCPDEYIKISRGQDFSHHVRDMTVSDNINLCIETYKGSVDGGLSSVHYSQITNPINQNTPNPFQSQPELWGRCGVNSVYYEKGQGSVPEISVLCGELDKMYQVINTNNITGFRKNVVLDSWKEASTQEMRNMYDPAFRNKFDFELSNIMLTASMHFRVDDKNVRIYTYGGRIVTGTGNVFDSSTHNLNFMYGAGVEINTNNMSEVVTRPETYRDHNNTSRNININIPTPRQ